jgi:hypothetical protein
VNSESHVYSRSWFCQLSAARWPGDFDRSLKGRSRRFVSEFGPDSVSNFRGFFRIFLRIWPKRDSEIISVRKNGDRRWAPVLCANTKRKKIIRNSEATRWCCCILSHMRDESLAGPGDGGHHCEHKMGKNKDSLGQIPGMRFSCVFWRCRVRGHVRRRKVTASQSLKCQFSCPGRCPKADAKPQRLSVNLLI